MPFRPPRFVQQQQPPPPDPDLIDNQLEWEVDFIKDARWTNRLRRSVQFLVHWKGYGSDEDTWEPARNLVNASDAIQEFYQQHLTKPRVLST